MHMQINETGHDSVTAAIYAAVVGSRLNIARGTHIRDDTVFDNQCVVRDNGIVMPNATACDDGPGHRQVACFWQRCARV